MADLGLQIARDLLQGGRVGVEIDEDETREFGDLDLIEADVIGVEILQRVRFRRADQLARETIDPGVIGAHDAAGIARALQQHMRAVLADIVEGAQQAVPGTGDHDRLARDIGGNVVAGSAQFLDVTDPLPVLRKNGLPVGLEPGIIGIGIGLQ